MPYSTVMLHGLPLKTTQRFHLVWNAMAYLMMGTDRFSQIPSYQKEISSDEFDSGGNLRCFGIDQIWEKMLQESFGWVLSWEPYEYTVDKTVVMDWMFWLLVRIMLIPTQPHIAYVLFKATLSSLAWMAYKIEMDQSINQSVSQFDLVNLTQGTMKIKLVWNY